VFVIGLTGGIASGKSTAAALLEELGAQAIDADLLGHRAYERGTSGFERVVEAFGRGVVGEEGAIDRRALSERVFGAPGAMRRLTDIVWPETRRLALREIADVRGREPEAVVVLEATLLLEAGWEDIVDEVWVVAVDPETALDRLTRRRGLSREEALRRIEAQRSLEERVERADRVIPNRGSRADLRRQLGAAWQALAERRAQQAVARSHAAPTPAADHA